jgi:hypothetical protein
MYKNPISIFNSNVSKFSVSDYFSQLVQLRGSDNVSSLLKSKSKSILLNKAFLFYRRLKHQLLLHRNGRMRSIGIICLRVTRSNVFLLFRKNNKVLYSLSSGFLGYKKRQRRMSLVVKPLFLKFLSKIMLMIYKYRIGPLKFTYVESAKYNNQFLSMLKYKLNMFLRQRLKQMSIFVSKRLVGQFRRYKKKYNKSSFSFNPKFKNRYRQDRFNFYKNHRQNKKKELNVTNQLPLKKSSYLKKNQDRKFVSFTNFNKKNKFVYMQNSNFFLKRNNSKRYYKDDRLPFLFLHGIHEVFEDRMSKWTRQELRNFIIHGIDPDEERRKEEESRIIEIPYVEKPKGSPSLPEKDIIYVESGKSDPKPIIEKEVDDVFYGEYHMFDPEYPENYKYNKPSLPEIITEEMVAAADAKAAARAAKKKQEEEEVVNINNENNILDKFESKKKSGAISEEEWKKLLNVVYVKELDAEMCSAVIPIDILLKRQAKLLKKVELKKLGSKKKRVKKLNVKKRKRIKLVRLDNDDWKKGGGTRTVFGFSRKENRRFRRFDRKNNRFKQKGKYKNQKRKKKPTFRFLVKMFRKRIIKRAVIKRSQKLVPLINLLKWWLRKRSLLRSTLTSQNLIRIFINKFKSGVLVNKRRRRLKSQYRSFRTLSRFKFLLPISYLSSSIYRKNFSGFFNKFYRYTVNRRRYPISGSPVRLPINDNQSFGYSNFLLLHKKFRYYHKFLTKKRQYLLRSLFKKKRNLFKFKQYVRLFSNSINFLKKFIYRFEKNYTLKRLQYERLFVVVNLCRALLKDLSLYNQNITNIKVVNSLCSVKRFLYKYSQLAIRSLFKMQRRYLLSLKANFTPLRLHNHLSLRKLKRNVIKIRKVFRKRKSKYKRIKYYIRGGTKVELANYFKNNKYIKGISGKKKRLLKNRKKNRVNRKSLLFYKKSLSKFSISLLKREAALLRRNRKSKLARIKYLIVCVELRRRKFQKKLFKNSKFDNALKNTSIEDFSLLRNKEDFQTILNLYKKYTNYYKFRKLARKSEYRIGLVNFLTYFIFKYGPINGLKKRNRIKFIKKIYYFLFKSRMKVHKSLLRRKLKYVRLNFLRRKFGNRVVTKIKNHNRGKKHRILLRKSMLLQKQSQKRNKYWNYHNRKRTLRDLKFNRFKKYKKRRHYRKRKYPLISTISRYETKHGFVNSFKKRKLYIYFKKHYTKLPKRVHLKFLKSFKLFYIGVGMLTHIVDKTSIPFGGNPRSRSRKEDRSW